MPDLKRITLTIDGKEIQVPPGTPVWEAARQLGIDIPAYCHHPRLEPIGACRMCLVEIEKMPKLAASCTTPVAEGMVVHTQQSSEKAKAGQEGMLELLLYNHPLDCPICDKGGECDLQNFAQRYGPNFSRVDVTKRKMPVRDLGKLTLDMERCVYCKRCIRFMEEYAGDNYLEFVNRGAETEVDTFERQINESPFAGNVIELCPVGALTSNVFRLKARVWELDNKPTICEQCGVGCHVILGTREQKNLLRITPDVEDRINEQWICDKGRFDHQYVDSSDRLKTPMLRKNGHLSPVTWQEAIAFIHREAREIKKAGENQVGGILGGRLTCEEYQLFLKGFPQRFESDLLDLVEPSLPYLHQAQEGLKSTDLELRGEDLDRADVILVLGDHLTEFHPIIDLKVRKHALRKYPVLSFPAYQQLSLEQLLACPEVIQAKRIVLLVTSAFYEGPTPAAIAKLLHDIVVAINGEGRSIKVRPLVREANAVGALQVGIGRSAYPEGSTAAMLGKAALGNLRGLVAWRPVGLMEWHDPLFVEKAFKTVPFSVVADLTLSEVAKLATVVLPTETLYEKRGTIVNAWGMTHVLTPSFPPLGSLNSDQEVLSELL